MKRVTLIIILSLSLPLCGVSQIVFDENGKVDEKKIKQWGSENIRNYFSLSTGLSIPTGNFADNSNSTAAENGYAKVGYNIGASGHYFIENYIGVIASFRYAEFGYDAEAYADLWDQFLQLAFLSPASPQSLPPTTVESGPYKMYNASIGASVRTPTIEGMDFEFGLKATYTFIEFPTIRVKNQLIFDVVEDFESKQSFTAEPFTRLHVRFSDNMGAFLHASYNGVESELEFTNQSTPAGAIGQSIPLDMKNTTLSVGLTFIFG